MELSIRPVKAGDQSNVTALIDSVYREYGDRLCLENADADLLDLEGNYLATGGAFVVLESDAGEIRGTHAALPLDMEAGLCTFRRLYLAPDYRGDEWGRLMMDWAFNWARTGGFKRVEFWSDVRFVRAHAFFAKFGFVKEGRRTMNDGSMPYEEYYFYRDVEA